MADTSQLYRHASSQRGLVTRRQLAALPLSPKQVRRLERSGALVAVTPQVLRVGGIVLDERAMALAACLDREAFTTLQTSARIHGIPNIPEPRRPQVVRVGGDAAYRSDIAEVHTTTALPAADRIIVDGIPCVTVARTLLALAAMVPDVSLGVVRGAVDDAVRMRLASDRWLWWRLEALRCRGRNGVAVLESILVERAGGKVTESWLEREFLALIESTDLPVPVVQARIKKRGAFLARVDFLYAERRIVIEVTGAVHHSTPAQRAADARRRNELLMQGFLVLEFTYEQVVGEPLSVLAQVREALARSIAA